jgi:NAD+ synthase
MQHQIQKITNFIQDTYQAQGFTQAVIAVSGGVDSALSLTLLSKALPPENIHPIFLPYQDQSTAMAQEICQFNHVPRSNWSEINIEPCVTACAQQLGLAGGKEGGSGAVSIESAEVSIEPAEEGEEREEHEERGQLERLRLGNIQARCRMIAVFDLAKKLSALVCGTENKTERMLGYFTRFGDGASDLEPIVHLFKTEVWELARYLNLPGKFIEQAPSAGLWPGQTDEQELGFSYEQADQVLQALEEGHGGEKPAELDELEVAPEVVERIKQRVADNKFKHLVPYSLYN